MARRVASSWVLNFMKWQGNIQRLALRPWNRRRSLTQANTLIEHEISNAIVLHLTPLVCQRAGAALGDGQEVSRRAATVWNHFWCVQVLLSRSRIRRVLRSTTAPVRSKVRRMRFGAGRGEHRVSQYQAAQLLDQGIGQS